MEKDTIWVVTGENVATRRGDETDQGGGTCAERQPVY